MTSPFKNIDNAFEPMFDEEILIETKDGSRQMLSVFVAIDETDDAMSDDMIDTDSENIVICSKMCDWDFITRIERGDKITRPMAKGKKYVVKNVDVDGVMGLLVKARSVK